MSINLSSAIYRLIYDAGQAFAKKGDVPTQVSQLTNDSGFQTEAQVNSIVSSAVASQLTTAVKYRGTVANRAALPANPQNGDMYNLADTGMNVVYNATSQEWDDQAPTFDPTGYVEESDLEAYVQKTELNTTLQDYVQETDLADMTTADVDAKFIEYGLLVASQVTNS